MMLMNRVSEIKNTTHRLGRLTLLAGVLMLANACSSVRPVDVGQRGLFQGDPAVANSSSGIKSFDVGGSRSRNDTLVWPVREGSVSSFFGTRRRHFHEGIDIRANRGTPIFAADDGVVLYSARRIKGYGNMIVIKHGGEISTVYAHCRKNLVRNGDQVKRGQLIALVGATGKATGPHLHFEVRKKELPQDPLLFLPQARSASFAGR